MPYLIALIAVVVLVVLLIQYWYITLPVALIITAAVITPRVVRYVRKERYFVSEAFLTHKTNIAAVVAEHNDIVAYTSELRDRGTFQIGASSTGSQAHLATFQNTSKHNYRRDRNVADYAAQMSITVHFRSCATPPPTRLRM